MSSTARAKPIDMDHLARYTGGDAALNAEVLTLFANQTVELLEKLQHVLNAGDLKTWKEITHSLKGAARGIGAFGFADAAANAEPVVPTPDNAGAVDALQALKSEAEIVRRFIDTYLAR